jgi:hypothetical protein
MTQPQPRRTKAPGTCGPSRPTPPRAAEAPARERTEGPDAGEVHVWFAAPRASSRYLDIVLAGRSAPSRS